MELLRPSDEAEVAETFRRGELAGRFREEVLAGTRYWRCAGLFDGLPDDLDWHRAALGPEEVLDIRYIDWDWWLWVSDGTRSPREAARRIHAGLAEGVDPEPLRALAARLASDDPPPELIAVAKPEGPLVLAEGHIRLTAYALYPEYLPARLEILLGISERAHEWSEY